MLTHISLFSGVGGIDLAAHWAGFQATAFCEQNEFCQKVLRKNFGAEIEIFDDVRTLTKESLRRRGVDAESVSLVSGGFPCQDISAAGKGEGITGERSGLWFEMRRIIGDVRPGSVAIENVPALRTRGADTVIEGLEALGYRLASPADLWPELAVYPEAHIPGPFVVGAWAVGAPHRRNRVFIVAHASGSAGGTMGDSTLGRIRCGRRWDAESAAASKTGLADPNGLRQSQSGGRESEQRRRPFDGGESGLADASSEGLQARRLTGEIRAPQPEARATLTRSGHQWPARPGERQHEWEAPRVIESRLGNSVNGISRRVAGYRTDKLKALGNAVNPYQVYPILKAIADYESSICQMI